MKRILAVVFTILAISAVALAQAEVDKALSALPANMPANAKDAVTVIHWKSDYTYDTLKKGAGKLVCYDRSGLPTHQPFDVECTSSANLERVAETLKMEAISDKDARQKAFEAAEKAGQWTKPEFGSTWFHFFGPDQEHARRHVTIAVPGATNKTMGLPEDNKQGGVWIMNAGRSDAHLMIPGN
jgi:hypothetical protein